MRLRDEVCMIALNIKVKGDEGVDVTSRIMGGCDDGGARENTLVPSPNS